MASTEAKADIGSYDCTFLDDIDEETIVETLRTRFKLGKMYTYIRDMVISVNPYRKLGWYTNDFIAEYKGTDLFSRPPHIYAVADSAFHGMVLFRKDACIIISGESGSGKTLASKYLTQYIAMLAPNVQSARVKNQLIVTGPLLEAFGNARTIRNNNASRFGKYIQIAFNLDLEPKGGRVRTYLLEKDRVVKQQNGERNFHCFYQLLAGAGERLMEDLQLEKDPSKYRYLTTGSSLTSSDESLYEDVLKSMMTLRFSKEDIENIRKLLAAILHLGNVEISKREDDGCGTVSNSKQLSKVARLLGTETDILVDALTKKTVQTANDEEVDTKLTVSQSCLTREALAKTMYERLFQLIVSRVNRALSVTDTSTNVVSILDFYGFEVFETNSFEQFWINYCNEQIQQLFIRVVLSEEQKVYQDEGVKWEVVGFTDNVPICRMMESMLEVMTEECARSDKQNNDSDCLLNEFDKTLSDDEHYSSYASGNQELIANEQFQITHYAGPVVYCVREFVEKNKDVQCHDLKRMLFHCTLPILKEMFPEGAEPTVEKVRRPSSVGERLKSDMCELVSELENQTPYWIRCIVPNKDKSSTEWDHELVLNQVRALQLVETTKIRKTGYAHEMDYRRFAMRYKMLDQALWPTHTLSDKKATKKLIFSYKLRQMVDFGKTKIFFKSQKTLYLLEAERQKVLPNLAVIVFRSIKRYHTRQQRQRMDALLTLVTAYRRKFVADWFAQVAERFKDCAEMSPDYGRSIKWPRAPPAMKLAERLLKRVHLSWWAKMRISQFSSARQYKLRLKTIAYGFLHGSKPHLQLTEKWAGDELGNKAMNPRASQFVEAMTLYQELYGDKKRLYSCHVTKLNRHLKSHSRVFVLCDKHFYRLTGDYRLAKKGRVDLEMVTGISISTGSDQTLVVHCVRRIGDCVFYLENNRPASEFLAVIWNILKRKYNRRLPVKVTDSMKFARPYDGIDVGDITLNETTRTKNPSFKKVRPKEVSVLWPTSDVQNSL